jgi:branched-chain amino acid transport system ATP-binding protein
MFEVRNITAGYGDTVVLRDVSVSVPDGSVVVLIGPNGAGKTTLLRVASGLLPLRNGGAIVADHTDLTGAAAHRFATAGVCHVPEGRGVFPSLTVRDNLVQFTPPGVDIADAVARATDAFPRLAQKLDQAAGTLSGGEQQMLALSRAYIVDARVVLLDEVSMGLAPRVVDEIYEFLVRLAATGTSLLLVEQYVTKALAMADYVYVLSRGQMTFACEPAELSSDDVFARYLGMEVSSAAS